jgi:ribonuclease HII
MRRALARLSVSPAYVLTDGFPVAGLPSPGLAVWKGDRVSASIAAASVVAKVTRDRIMVRLHDQWPHYDFADHKGYVTPVHNAALDAAGPCAEHRFSYINVARRARGDARVPARTLARIGEDDADLGVVDVADVDVSDVEVTDAEVFAEDMRELEEVGIR